MKIAHTADLHLGKKFNTYSDISKRRYDDFFDRFESLADYVINYDIRVLIIAGDLFDKKDLNADILEKCEKILHKIIYDEENKRRNIDILVCEGNHDIYREDEESWLFYLKRKKLIHFFKYDNENIENSKLRIEDINFYIVGYHGANTDNVLIDLAEKLNPDEKNYIITHTALLSDFNLPGLVKAETISLFKDKVIYIAGGHIHSHSAYPKDNPYFFVPGSLEFTNFYNEGSENKTFIVFDSEKKEIERVEINNRKRIKTEIFKYKNINNIEEEFKNFLGKYNLSGEELLIVEVEIKTGDFLANNLLRDIALKSGALEVFIKNLYKNAATGNNFSENNTYSLAEHEAFIINKWNIFKEPELFIENFSNLKKLQEEAKEEEFKNLLDYIFEKAYLLSLETKTGDANEN